MTTQKMKITTPAAPRVFYGLDDLEVEEYITVTHATRWASARAAASKYGRESGKKFSCRQVTNGTKTILKVIRIA